jgi:WD40 repeat protein
LLAVGTSQLKVTAAGLAAMAGFTLETVNIDVWDWNAGRKMQGIVHPIPQRTGKVLASELLFSADGRSMSLTVQTYTAGLWSKLQQTDICSWEVTTRRQSGIFTIPGPSTPTQDLPDFEQRSGDAASYAVSLGGDLAASIHDGTIQLWDPATGRQTGQLRGHTETVLCLAFSASGELLATGGADETIRLWDLTKMRELRTFEGKPPAVIAINFSSDGRWLQTADLLAVSRWEVSTGRQLRTLKIAETGRSVEDASFGSNGARLVTPGSDARSTTLWDLDSEQQVRSLTSAGEREAGKSALSADGRLIAITDHVFTIQKVARRALDRFTVGFSNQDELSKIEKEIEALEQRNRKRDRERLAELSEKKIELLNQKGRGLRQTRDLQDPAEAISEIIGEDTPEKRPQIEIWDLLAGRRLHGISGHLVNIEALAFSSDGSLLATGGTEGVILLWDTASGQIIRRFENLSRDQPNSANSFGSVGRGTDTKLPISAMGISPDGKLIAAGYTALGPGQGFARLWDAASGSLRSTLPGAGDVSAVAFSQDARWVATGAWDGSLKIWNAATGTPVASCAGHRARIDALSFHPGGRVLASGGKDGVVRLWDATTCEPLASLISLPLERDWLAVTPDGLFDGSPGAWQRIGWRFSKRTEDVAPIEIYFNEFFYPGLLGEILTGNRPKAPRNLFDLDRRQPKLNISVKGASNAVADSRQVAVTVEVIDAPAEAGKASGSGARDVRLFRNGSLVHIWRGNVLTGGAGRVVLETSVKVVAGENRLTAYGFNHDNIRSATSTLIITGSAQLRRPGTMHILTVGVNKYANPEFNLNYAVADATALGVQLADGQAGIRRFARTDRTLLLDENATKANILYALSRLAGLQWKSPPRVPDVVASLEVAQPEDAVVIYFAGHGTSDQSRFFLVPHDLGYSGHRSQLNRAATKIIHANSVSDLDLEQVFEKLDVENLLLVIDACDSGQALESEERRRGPMNSKGLAQLAYEKGMYVLTATQPHQAALEASQLGHGYLTFALLEEGLKTAVADTTPKDGDLSAAEWLDYATFRVPQLQRDGMRKARDQGRELVFAQGEERIRDITQRSFQRPRVFYRSEVGLTPLIVAKPQ